MLLKLSAQPTLIPVCTCGPFISLCSLPRPRCLLPRSELAAIPQATSAADQQAAQDEADAIAADENPSQMPIAEAAGEELQNSAAEQGFVIENNADELSSP